MNYPNSQKGTLVTSIPKTQNIPRTPIHRETERERTIDYCNVENQNANITNSNNLSNFKKTGTFGILGNNKSSTKKQMMYDSFVHPCFGPSTFKKTNSLVASGPHSVLNSFENKLTPNNAGLRPNTSVTPPPEPTNNILNYSHIPSSQVKKVIRYDNVKKLPHKYSKELAPIT